MPFDSSGNGRSSTRNEDVAWNSHLLLLSLRKASPWLGLNPKTSGFLLIDRPPTEFKGITVKKWKIMLLLPYCSFMFFSPLRVHSFTNFNQEKENEKRESFNGQLNAFCCTENEKTFIISTFSFGHISFLVGLWKGRKWMRIKVFNLISFKQKKKKRFNLVVTSRKGFSGPNLGPNSVGIIDRLTFINNLISLDKIFSAVCSMRPGQLFRIRALDALSNQNWLTQASFILLNPEILLTLRRLILTLILLRGVITMDAWKIWLRWVWLTFFFKIFLPLIENKIVKADKIISRTLLWKSMKIYAETNFIQNLRCTKFGNFCSFWPTTSSPLRNLYII